ncbi:unnamed protein product, partial [Didymodactylos carnosus]
VLLLVRVVVMNDVEGDCEELNKTYEKAIDGMADTEEMNDKQQHVLSTSTIKDHQSDELNKMNESNMSIDNDIILLVEELIEQIVSSASSPIPSSSSTEFVTFVVDDITDRLRSSTFLNKNGDETPSAATTTTSGPNSSSLSSSIVDVSTCITPRSISPPTTTSMTDPHLIPPIDKQILDDIELYSKNVASDFVQCIEQMTQSLHHMSAISVCCLQTYRDVVGEKLNETIESNIKTIYALMAQAEQLSIQLAPIYELQKKINFIKQLLDILQQSI